MLVSCQLAGKSAKDPRAELAETETEPGKKKRRRTRPTRRQAQSLVPRVPVQTWVLPGRTADEAPRARQQQPELVDLAASSSSDVEVLPVMAVAPACEKGAAVVYWDTILEEDAEAGTTGQDNDGASSEAEPGPAAPAAELEALPSPPPDQQRQHRDIPWDELFPPTKSAHRRYIVETVLPQLVPFLRDATHARKSPRELANLAVDEVDRTGKRQWGAYELYSRRRTVVDAVLSQYYDVLHEHLQKRV